MKKVNGKWVVAVLLLIVLAISAVALVIQNRTNKKRGMPVDEARLPNAVRSLG